MKIATLFSGIGSPEQGAARVYPDHKIIFACEFDKFARQSYEANYEIAPEHFHVDVNELDATQYRGDVDILIGGSPCQSFSLAGLRKGTECHRGQLIYEYIRVVDECRPEVIVYENVKGIMSIDGGQTIKDFVQALRDIGYHCHYGVVNTKDYGVPQNRERIFLVGFQDADLYHKFHFADKIKLEKRLKDVLEDDMDEKYYLSDKMLKGFMSHKERHEEKGTGFIYEPKDGDDIANCLRANAALCPTDNTIKVVGHSGTGGQRGDIISPEGISSCLSATDYKQPKQIEVLGLLDIKGTDQIRVVEPLICASRGRNPDNPSDRTAGNHVEQRLEVNTNGTSNALTSVQKDNYVLESTRIRKLTPRECLRLQDFPDTFVQVVSDSQMYKQAGNSMSVNILEMIFNQIEKAKRGECRNSLLDFMEAV